MATSETQPKAASDKTAASKTSASAPAAGDGVKDEARNAHEARTAVPGADGVDARLDNRRGADRPPLETWPAKPQQIDGPDVLTQVEHTRKTLADREDAGDGDRKGMFSAGPHGLSDESLRESGPKGATEPLYGTESLTEAEVADGAAKAKS